MEAKHIILFVTGNVSDNYIRKFAKESFVDNPVSMESHIDGKLYLQVGDNDGLDTATVGELLTILHARIDNLAMENNGDYLVDEDEWLWVDEDWVDLRLDSYPDTVVRVCRITA